MARSQREVEGGRTGLEINSRALLLNTYKNSWMDIKQADEKESRNNWDWVQRSSRQGCGGQD